MGPALIIGLMVGLLLASIAGNIALLRARESAEKLAAARVQDAEDRLDAMLARISTSPRLEIGPAAPPKIDPEEIHSFSDFDEDPTAVEAWNQYRGEIPPEERSR